LLLIAERIHRRAAAVRIIRNQIPTTSDVRLLIVAFLSKEGRGHLGAALWARGAAPLPVDFAELELLRDAEVAVVGVGLDCVGDDYLAGEVRAGLLGLLVVEIADRRRAVIITELVYDRRDGHCEFAIEDAGPIPAVDVNVILARAGVVAVDDVVVV